MSGEMRPGPMWIPTLHQELTQFVAKIGIPRDESPGIADEAIVLTLIRHPEDPCLLEPAPSEAIRMDSFAIARNKAVDHQRKSGRGITASKEPATESDEEHVHANVPATERPVGDELAVHDEFIWLLPRLGATAEKLCGTIKDPNRRDYARDLLFAYFALSASGDGPPSGRSLGRRMTEAGHRQRDGNPFSEQTACDVLYAFFEMFEHDYPRDE